LGENLLPYTTFRPWVIEQPPYSIKKGYLSPFHHGSLEALSKVLGLVAEWTEQRTINSDAILYGAAFQAGIDEFLVSKTDHDLLRTSSTFVASRTTPL
jgi:hypothetical protein